MKRLKRKSKIFIVLSCLFAFIGLFAFSSYAYEFDDNGNMLSSNLMNYQDISSSTFIDLDNYQFEMNWAGVSSSITLPDVTYAENTAYTFSLTSVSGTTTYWAYNLFWNYTDSTSERFTNNQSLDVGRYSFTSDSTKTLSSITWLINFSAVFENLMLNVGDQPIAFEPYGYTWYSQDNYNLYGSNQYDIGYSTGVNDGASDSLGSVLYYKNLKFAWVSYTPNSYNFTWYYVFVYNGVCGYWQGTDISSFDSSAFVQYDSSTPLKFANQYGFFYNTDWTLYDFLNQESDYPYADPDKPAILNFEFSTPQSLNNVGFEKSGFNYVYAYSGSFANPYLLSTNTESFFSLILGGVSGIYAATSIADFSDEGYYLVANVYDSYYSNGYTNGYNAASSVYSSKIKSLESKIIYMQNNIRDLQATIKEFESGGANYQNLIWTIASTPWESFKSIWNVNFVGINIASIITGFLTALIILYIIKKVF